MNVCSPKVCTRSHCGHRPWSSHTSSLIGQLTLLAQGKTGCAASLAPTRSPCLAPLNARLGECEGIASSTVTGIIKVRGGERAGQVPGIFLDFSLSWWVPFWPCSPLLHVQLSFLTLVLLISGTTQNRKATGLHTLPT